MSGFVLVESAVQGQGKGRGKGKRNGINPNNPVLQETSAVEQTGNEFSQVPEELPRASRVARSPGAGVAVATGAAIGAVASHIKESLGTWGKMNSYCYSSENWGCHKGYCWSYCTNGLGGWPWCYTTADGYNGGNYAYCRRDSDCECTWSCAGACSL